MASGRLESSPQPARSAADFGVRGRHRLGQAAPSQVDRPSALGEAFPSQASGRPASAVAGPTIEKLRVRAATIPTDAPESDGTLAWTSTTLVIVEIWCDGVCGLGYTYAAPEAARLVADTLSPLVLGREPSAAGEIWSSMVAAVRNMGREGIAATAISAVDTALWDLRARLMGVPLVDLLGRCRDAVRCYGSGGFTSYSDSRIERQLAGWAAEGFDAVKMKIGREPKRDPHRVEIARQAIGPAVELFVDANGAHDRRRGVQAAAWLGAYDVSWFEEPVSSDDVEGLRFVRDHAPPGMAIAAGEYAWGPDAVRRLVEGAAVDVLQADATRCLGITGFMAAAAVAEAWHVPLSAHCAPTLHAPLMAAARPGIHLEWFHDHARIEEMVFDGNPRPVEGRLRIDRVRPGLGIELREGALQRHLVWSSS